MAISDLNCSSAIDQHLDFSIPRPSPSTPLGLMALDSCGDARTTEQSPHFAQQHSGHENHISCYIWVTTGTKVYQTSLHVVMVDPPKSQHKLVYPTTFLRLVEFLSFLNTKLTNWLFSFLMWQIIKSCLWWKNELCEGNQDLTIWKMARAKLQTVEEWRRIWGLECG